MIHELINTAHAHCGPDSALENFAYCEQIDDHIHAAEMVKEIIVERDISDDEEKEALTKLFRLVTTAPYGKSLSLAKVTERGEYVD
jgi:hypothetical protein